MNQCVAGTGRIAWVDMAKGYGVLCIIICHMQVPVIYSWLCSFHVPLFFFLSGYVFHVKDNFKHFAMKKVRSIVIPYFCMAAIIVLYRCIACAVANGDVLQCLVDESLGFLLQRRKTTLWFFACLLCLNFLFHALVRTIKNLKILGLCAAMLAVAALLYFRLGGGALPWNADACFTALPFFFAGYLLKNKHEWHSILFNGRKKWLLFMLAVVANCGGYIAQCLIDGDVLDFYSNEYSFAPIAYLTAFAGIYCVVFISNLFVLPPVSYIGENSILYFSLHQSVIMPIIFSLYSLCDIPYQGPGLHLWLWYIVTLILILTSITLLNALIKRTRFRFMIGK